MIQPKKKLAKPNAATRQDSLDVYNRSLEVENFYKKEKYRKTKDEYYEGRYALKNNDIHYNTYKDDYARRVNPGLFESSNVKRKEYRKTIDKNKYYQRENADHQLNTNAPMQLFDRRILPVSSVAYESGGDYVTIPSYNNIANKPFDLLTPKEKEQRVKQFGRSGVPSSYSSKPSPISTLSTKSTKPSVTRSKYKDEQAYKNSYPPIYLTNKNDPRINQFTENGNQYLYKEPVVKKKAPPIKLNPPLTSQGLVSPNMTVKASTTITQPARVPKSYQVEEQSTMPFGSHTTTYEVSDINNITAGATGTGDKRKITPKYAEGGKIDPPNKNKAEIRPYVSQDYLDRAWEILSNPLTSFGYLARNENIPTNLKKGLKANPDLRNSLDNPLDLVNPTYYANSAGKIVEGVVRGKRNQVIEEGLNFVPVFKKARAAGRIVRNSNKIKGVLNTVGQTDAVIHSSTGKGLEMKAMGGEIDPPIKTVKEQAEFNNNWFANRVINNVPINVKSRVTVPESVNISNLNQEGAKSTTYGQYNPQNKSITLDPRFKEKTGIPAHEQYHEFQDNLREEDKSKYEKYIENPIQEVLKDKNISRAYDADPEEVSAKLQQLRWGKDFKPNQVITPKDVEKVDLNSYNLQDFDREQVVKLLNTVAYNDNSNTNSMKQYAKRLTLIKGKQVMASGGRLPYTDRHIAPSTLLGGAASIASVIPGGQAVGAGLSLISGLLGGAERRKEERKQEESAKGRLISSQLANDAILSDAYDSTGNSDVQYYANGGGLPSTGNFNTTGGDLVPISSSSEVAVGNTHGEKTIDNSYGITLEKGNTPIAEIENKEVVKDGEKVYSDRLMYNSTQSFADKAKQLGIKAGKIESKLNNTKDTKDRNGYERQLAGIKMGEEALFRKQEEEKLIQGEQELAGLPKMYTGGKLDNEQVLTPSGNTLDLPAADYSSPYMRTAPVPKTNKPLDFVKDLAPNLIDNIGNAFITANTPKVPSPVYNPAPQIETEINVNPQLAEITNSMNTIQDNILRSSNDSNVARANIASSRLRGLQAKLGVLDSKQKGEQGLRNTQAQMVASNAATNNAKTEEYNNLQFARKNEIASRWSGNLANIASDIKSTQTRQESKDYYNKVVLSDLLDDKTGQKLRTFMNNPELFNLSPEDRQALIKEYRRRQNNSITPNSNK